MDTSSADEQDLKDYLDWCVEHYLTLRPRSEREVASYIRRKLIQKGVREKDQQSKWLSPIIEKFKSSGAIDDKSFVEWYVEERQYFKPRGRRGLDYELRQKGIDQNTIKSHLDTITIEEEPLIIKILQKKFSTKNLQNPAEKNKATQHLLRRGFAYGQIKKAIEDFVIKE